MTTSCFSRLSVAVLVLVAVMIGSIQLSEAQDKTTKAQLMFVQVADNLKVDPAAKTLRLAKVNQQTLYFSDRPQRIAGHMKMADYLKEWTARAGKDNFGKNPPNAALSVYEPGHPDSTLAVIEITNPVVNQTDLIYNYKLINGKLPVAGGETALFIDWIGVGFDPGFGGDPGFGFHGLGVSAPGFGVRR